ncbi:DUF4328 domain-containing protein [Nocardioides plantarum]|uniref:DUF4328 domain-containing protein n=1 Tax=Nocardioides plantarum TaxID=29299 RepID=A0ABV5KAQ3_9ACTN|nr:DUF4328 domain-containing protein [Nocardioides plantarum]
MTEPPTPSYAAPRARPHGKPPISLPPVSAERPHHDTARMLAIGVVVLSAVYTGLTVLAEVPLGLATLDQANGRDPDGASTLGAVLVVASLLLLLPLWVVTSLWLRAERERLGGAGSFAHGTAGTFASWVVPFANLVWPFRVVREVHERAVEPRYRVSLGWWWTLWLLAVVLDRLSLGFYDRQDSGDPTAGILATSALSSMALVVALVLWVGIVQRTSRVRT